MELAIYRIFCGLVRRCSCYERLPMSNAPGTIYQGKAEAYNNAKPSATRPYKYVRADLYEAALERERMLRDALGRIAVDLRYYDPRDNGIKPNRAPSMTNMRDVSLAALAKTEPKEDE
jgi:hypothetical protein